MSKNKFGHFTGAPTPKEAQGRSEFESSYVINIPVRQCECNFISQCTVSLFQITVMSDDSLFIGRIHSLKLCSLGNVCFTITLLTT